MAKFRKKTIIVEAVQFIDQDTEIAGPEPDWYQAARTIDAEDVGSVTYRGGSLFIHTLEGIVQARPYAWIVRGIKQELYPVKPDIFAETYELVEDANG